MNPKPTITQKQCDQCRQEQSDTLWLVFAIGFIIGGVGAVIAAWLIAGML